MQNNAVKLTRESATAKFDESIEVHLSTNADPRHADQQLREVVSLPHSLGDIVRVLVFAEGEGARIAAEAGADYIVDDEMLARIQGGWTDWEVSLATPDQMPKVGRLGRVLGPRGLMPNPRNNTVVLPNKHHIRNQRCTAGTTRDTHGSPRKPPRTDRQALVHRRATHEQSRSSLRHDLPRQARRRQRTVRESRHHLLRNGPWIQDQPS